MILSKPNIIVCGDIMLDYNIFVKIEKIANEAPIPVFNLESEVYALGGCGNVLKNLANIVCNKLFIFSAIGNDRNSLILTKLVEELKVVNRIQHIDGYNTTTKKRYFCDNKIMFRCDTENISEERKYLEPLAFADEIESILKTEHIDCIILSDYNKGLLTKEQCQAIIRVANKYNVFTCVDPKHDYTKYIGCSLIKPNRKEAYDIFHFDKSKNILDLHKHIYTTIGCKYSVITLAENGITLYDGEKMIQERPNVHSIIDVTGAGDIVCCILGYFLSRSTSPKEVIQLATRIATKSVEHPGTYTITPNDILLPELSNGKIIQFNQLQTIKYINVNKKIVFTNGCFDLLHSGHISLFKFCRTKGDIVIVGLNSDNSIRRLKGTSRPINTIKTRIDVLESIQYIDYIIEFDDDTPYAIIKELNPYYLIKGGDYKVDNIIGREFAQETIVCDTINGYSSTSIINKIASSVKDT